jgi:hypothetical protein
VLPPLALVLPPLALALPPLALVLPPLALVLLLLVPPLPPLLVPGSAQVPLTHVRRAKSPPSATQSAAVSHWSEFRS